MFEPHRAGLVTQQSDRLNQWLDRRHAILLPLFAVVLFVSLAARARVTPFWHDEIYTLLASRLLPTALWSALRDGLDLMPPLNTILTHLVHAATGPGPIASRLPPLTGFVGATLVVVAIVRRRANAVTAWGAAMLFCFTMGSRFAFEARGYGLTIGAFAVALFAWSEAAAGRARPRNLVLLALAIALGIWAHYYAVLALLPIAGGEAVRDLRARKLDVPIWLALVVGGLLALPLYPLISANLPRTSTFWTQTEPATLRDTYMFVLGTAGGTRFQVIGAIVATTMAAGALLWRHGPPPARRLPAYESVAGLICLAIPGAGYLIGTTIGHGVFVERYVLLATVSVAVVIPLVVWRFGPRNGAAELVMFGLVGIMFGRMNWQTVEPGHLVFQDPLSARPLLGRSLAEADPVVVTGGVDYLPLWYYASPDQKKRIVYLAEPASELRETGTDTVDEGYLALERYDDVGVWTPDAFLAQHRRFRLYNQPPNWILPELKARGAVLREEGSELGAVLFRVGRPD